MGQRGIKLPATWMRGDMSAVSNPILGRLLDHSEARLVWLTS